ncbi:MAG: hypothetical protein RR061_07695 [Muribaculaceae bacterium]
MQTLQAIKQLVEDNNINEAIDALNLYILSEPTSDEAFFLRGNLYRRIGDMRRAINDFCEAIERNPQSPAVEAYRATQEILGFFNPDVFNP